MFLFCFIIIIQVEENYPRLLDQVTAIEQLDSAHAHFAHEMEAVAKKADSLANTMGEQVGGNWKNEYVCCFLVVVENNT